MAEALFYHLMRRRLEEALPPLLEKTLARGWRAVVRVGGAARLEALNRALWTYDAGGFLPHGAAEDGASERQPIFLTAGLDAPNAPDVLFLVDGAAAQPAEMAGYQRACMIFDGGDADALSTARAAWKASVSAGLDAVYWAETDSGGWTKKAEKRAGA